MINRMLYIGLIWLTIPVSTLADNVTATVTVTDANQLPVKNAVVIFTPLFKVNQALPKAKPAIMNQINKQFVPHVLVVPRNTEITFPNADNVFHHVYSFSPAKQFELKLYKEFTAEPLFFEQPGIVDIGCNIHDWMLGYIVVSESPYFLKTDDTGSAGVALPKGQYRLSFWHPQAANEMPFTQPEMEITDSKSIVLTLQNTISNDSGFDDGFGDY